MILAAAQLILTQDVASICKDFEPCFCVYKNFLTREHTIENGGKRAQAAD